MRHGARPRHRSRRQQDRDHRTGFRRQRAAAPAAGGAARRLPADAGRGARSVRGRGVSERLDPQDCGPDRVQPGRHLQLLPQQGRHLLCVGRGGIPHPVAWPRLLPGHSTILASAAQEGSAGELGFRIVAFDAKTGARRKVLLESVGETHWLPTGSRSGLGHLVYGRSGSLYAAPFDAATLAGYFRALDFSLGPRQVAGLREFARRAAVLGAAPALPPDGPEFFAA